MNEDFPNQSPKPKLQTIYNELNLIQHIETATRITQNSATIINHMVTNLQDNVITSGTISHLNWKQNLIKKKIHEIWYYDQGNYSNLNTEYNTQNWDSIIDIDMMNINEAYTNVTEKMIDIARKHIPAKGIIIKLFSKPWYSTEMKKLKKKLLRISKNAQRLSKESEWEKYRKARNERNTKIRNAKTKYPEKLGSELKDNIHKPQISELMKGKNTQYPTTKT